MAIRVDTHHGDRIAARFWLFLGWVLWGVGVGVILLPAVMVVVRSGSFSGLGWLVFYWGLGLSAWQGAVWMVIWFARRRLDAPKRRMMFGIGVPLCLLGSVGVLAALSSFAWSGLAYLLIAALVVWTTDRLTTERS